MLTSLRAQLVADLAITGIPVHTAWPARVTPPCLFVAPSSTDPYVTQGNTFGSFRVSLDVVILAAHKAPDIALAELDSVIETVLANSEDWELGTVDDPSLVKVNGIEYLGTIVHISKQARL